MSISNSTFFIHSVLDPFKQNRLDFSNPKQTFVWIQLLEIWLQKVSLFRYQLCQTQVKILPLSSHTTVDWKHQRCKYTMVYSKYSFIERLFLFQFIHNMALLQGLVMMAIGIKIKNFYIIKKLLALFPETSIRDACPYLVWIVWRSTLQFFSR